MTRSPRAVRTLPHNPAAGGREQRGRAVHASAPVRIDLAGGTVDLWPLYLFFPGAVTVNVAVEIRAHCWVEEARRGTVTIESRDRGLAVSGPSLQGLPGAALPLPRILASRLAPRGGFRMVLDARAPAGSGLGGSSALAVAIARALVARSGVRQDRGHTLEICRNAEARVLGVPTGDQDYHPALWGGLVALHLGLDGVEREPLRIDLDALERRLVLGYSGVSRNSGLNNWDVYRGVVARRPALLRGFERIVEAAVAMRNGLVEENWGRVAAAMDADWRARRRLAPGIRTPELDRIERAARRAGAEAAKVCGAGGGGCIAFLTPPERRAAVEDAIGRAGGEVLPVRIARSGVRCGRVPRERLPQPCG